MNNRAGNNLIYGIHAVSAMLERDPSRVRMVWIAKEAQKNRRIHKLQGLADRNGVEIRSSTHAKLDAMAGGERHQGVVAECDAAASAAAKVTDVGELLAKLDVAPFLLILDGVTDPHNLGACLRSADAAGVHAVIVPKDRAVGITPVVTKVACGAAEHVPLIQVTNLARTLRQLKEEGVWLMGLDERGESTVYEADLKGPLALVLGAEGEGLRRLTREECDLLISIPMAGSVASLNVSVATGVSLFEAVRQRRS